MCICYRRSFGGYYILSQVLTVKIVYFVYIRERHCGTFNQPMCDYMFHLVPKDQNLIFVNTKQCILYELHTCVLLKACNFAIISFSFVSPTKHLNKTLARMLQ